MINETNNEPDHQETFTIDRESFDRLTKGADFQRSTNLLAMLIQTTEQITKDALKSFKLPKSKAKKLRARLRKANLKNLLDNPPPDIDQDALKAFCE